MTQGEFAKRKYEQLREDRELVKKYNKAGIYSISIEDKLVYIGKSKNMLQRLAAHIANILYNDNSHKYQILSQAYNNGFSINFDCVCQCQEHQLDMLEGYYIRLYQPSLNYQIPKEDNPRSYTINKKAKYIKLEEIIGLDTKNSIK